MKWKDKINRKYMQISLYVIITVVIIYSLSLILKNVPSLTRAFFEKLSWVITVLKPIILGFVFAYLMDPVVNFFEKKYRKLKNIKPFNSIVAPRTWAAFTSVLILIIAISGLISLLVFTVTNQLRLASLDDIVKLAQDYKKSFDAFYVTISNKLTEFNIQSQAFDEYFKNASTFLLDTLKGIATAALTSVTNISGYLTTIIFSFIIGFYFLIDGRMFISYIVKVCRALFSDNINRNLYNTAHDLDEVFSGYIRGQLTDAFVMLILISIVLSVIGVKFAILIGICAGIGNLIPYFGPIVAYVSTTIVCLMNGEMNTLIVSLIALFIIQALDGNVIGPKLLSQSIQIHPLIIIISIIIGSALGGFLGMLLAVPVGAYLKLIFVRFVDHRLEYKEEMKRAESLEKVKK
ncbi:MAG: AI-2E family transporter [Herbinix sp.]|nr:AI-2E family transporter [Herbinix sp.]